MAQRRTTSGKRKTSSSSSRKRTTSKSSSVTSTAVDYYHAFSKTRFFVPVMTVVVLTVLILLDLLFSLNDYDRFFKILGFELLIVGIIWVIGLVLSFGESTPSSGK
jgi:hypothetical protein